MSGKIWLIAEDENDYRIVQAIIKARKVAVRVMWRSPTGKTPGLSRLAAELSDLIAEVNKLRSGDDCIVVLHDDDIHREPRRDDYNKVRNLCRKHKVYEVIAEDEIEAWLLSDSGVCKWLDEVAKTWNGDPFPSDRLRSLMRERYRLRYPRDLDKALKHLSGDGINQSLQKALNHLDNAPCVSK